MNRSSKIAVGVVAALGLSLAVAVSFAHPGGMGPDRHTAYAVQWFGLALTVVVIYLVLVARNGKQAS